MIIISWRGGGARVVGASRFDGRWRRAQWAVTEYTHLTMIVAFNWVSGEITLFPTHLPPPPPHPPLDRLPPTLPSLWWGAATEFSRFRCFPAFVAIIIIIIIGRTTTLRLCGRPGCRRLCFRFVSSVWIDDLSNFLFLILSFSRLCERVAFHSGPLFLWDLRAPLSFCRFELGRKIPDYSVWPQLFQRFFFNTAHWVRTGLIDGLVSFLTKVSRNCWWFI